MTDRKSGTMPSIHPGRGFGALPALLAVMLAISAPAGLAQQPPPARPESLPDRHVAEGAGLAGGRDATLRLDEAPPLHDLAGPYLAARQASGNADFVAAAHYYALAAEQDPRNPMIMDSLLYALVASGRVEEAFAQAQAMDARGDGTDMARLMIRAGFAAAEDWAGLLDSLGDAPRVPPGGVLLLDGMMRGWALLGEGRASDAIAQLQALTLTRGARAMVDYNLAMMKAMVGDFESALALLEKPEVGQHLLGTMAHAEILAQLDQREDALAVLDAQPGGADEPAIIALRALIASDAPVPFTAMTSARQGIAQLFLTFASVLGGSADPDPLSLVHARLAVWVDPDLGEARLVLAQILQDADQYDMAAEQYDQLSAMGEVRPVAELARIDSLARARRHDQALEAVDALIEHFPDLASAWVAKGDILRQSERFSGAADAYGHAITLIPEGEARWFPLFARGMSLERAGDFPSAESDLREALKYSPDHPQILNYLGYSLIDRGEKLDEALAMIERAVQMQPDGYILDSLAWGYYRLGRYEDAVAPMEQAVAQMADDPLVNDHLGDVYWMAGRHREAEIQWRRALSLLRPDTASSEEVDPVRVRAKLARGLDAVLEDEAAGRPLLPEDAEADDADGDDGDGADSR